MEENMQVQSNEATFKQNMRRATENKINLPFSLPFITSRNNANLHNKEEQASITIVFKIQAGLRIAEKGNMLPSKKLF